MKPKMAAAGNNTGPCGLKLLRKAQLPDLRYSYNPVDCDWMPNHRGENQRLSPGPHLTNVSMSSREETIRSASGVHFRYLTIDVTGTAMRPTRYELKAASSGFLQLKSIDLGGSLPFSEFYQLMENYPETIHPIYLVPAIHRQAELYGKVIPNILYILANDPNHRYTKLSELLDTHLVAMSLRSLRKNVGEIAALTKEVSDADASGAAADAAAAPVDRDAASPDAAGSGDAADATSGDQDRSSHASHGR